jgi:hypothetical protein
MTVPVALFLSMVVRELTDPMQVAKSITGTLS